MMFNQNRQTEMIKETIEFDAPAPGGGTTKKSGRVLEDLGNGRLRVEILVGGETTTMIVNPDVKKPEKKAKPGRKPKAKPEAQLNLFPSEDFAKKLSSLQEDFEAQLGEIKALVSPASDAYRHLLHDDITHETVIEPVMYREDILGPKPKYRTIQRHHVGDSRYYVQQFEQPDGSWSRPQLYAGVTSVVGKVLPESEHLKEWYASFPSYELALKELNKLAARGTVMHSLFAMVMDPNTTLPDFGTADFDRLLRQLIAGQDGIDVNEVFGEWKVFMCKAILGFKQFCYDYNVEPLAVEIVLGQPHQYFEDGSKTFFGYFAQVDLICFLDIEVEGFFGEVYKSGENKGKPKKTKTTRRVLGIVDFKSGTSDSEEHDMQLLLQIPLVKAAFPHIDLDIHIFNWHPSDFRISSLAKKAEKEDGPELKFGYSLLEKENTPFRREWAEDHLWMWRKYHAKELPKKMVFQGSPNIDTRPSENVNFLDYVTFWEEKIARAITHKFADL